MKWLEKFSMNTGELLFSSYLKTFAANTPDKVILHSLKCLDPIAVNQIKDYLISRFSNSGGFFDRAGKPDLYYTLFGYFIVKAYSSDHLFPGISAFTQDRIRTGNLTDVHLYCAAILTSTTPTGWGYPDGVVYKRNVKKSIRTVIKQQKLYNAFLGLMTCYYMRDYAGIYRIRKLLDTGKRQTGVPSTLLAAELVLQKSFNRNTSQLINRLLTFYDDHGGFKATESIRLSDLLSTAVALYALKFAGYDMRMIRPACLDYIDSLYHEGGFAANAVDPDTDIEYTFYGLLALGALANEQQGS
jgi:hypothetical protein